MRLGVVIMPADPWSTSVATAQQIENLGYDHLWTYDHYSWRHYRDRSWHATYPWLAGLATATTRIRLGTMVANPNVRHPLELAKNAMTLDHLSEGRFTLGIGAGGTGFDATVLGQRQLTPAERAGRLEEFVIVTDGLLRGSLVDHSGSWYEVNGGRVHPGSVQQPRLPIAIAAGGTRTLRLTAEVADAWITYGDTTLHDLSESGTEVVVKRQLALIEDRCTEIGRNPEDIDRIYLIGIAEARPLGSIEQFVDFAGRYKELGFTDLVFHHPRPDDPVWNEPAEIVEEIAAEMLTHVAKGD